MCSIDFGYQQNRNMEESRMGFRVQLIAISGKKASEIHAEYGIVSTGKFDEIPDAPVSGASLPGGAYLLYINDEIEPDDLLFAKLSKKATLFACYANETVMNSYCCCWTNGIAKWTVFHDAQQDLNHLEVSGTLPAEFKPIHDRMIAQQTGVDDPDYIFDVPVELFVACGGIRYDQDIEGAGPNPWEILERV